MRRIHCMARHGPIRTSAWLRSLVVVFSAMGCQSDHPLIVPPDPRLPPQVRPGIFRLTFNRGADLHPGWLDSVTVAYQAENLPGFDPSIILFTRSITGGPSQALEPAELFARHDIVEPITASGEGGARYAAVWGHAIPKEHTCPTCPAAVREVTIVRLDAGGTTPTGQTQWIVPAAGLVWRVVPDTMTVDYRLLPAHVDALAGLRNPYGPGTAPGSQAFVASDGETIFHGPGIPSSLLDSVTAGAYPSLSRDGSRIVFTRFAVSDTGVETCEVLLATDPDFVCRQRTTAFAVRQREIWVRELATGTEIMVAVADHAVFDRASDRILVTMVGGLTWIDLVSGAEAPVPNTAGAHSPAVSPGGRYVAFVAEWDGQPDVYIAEVW